MRSARGVPPSRRPCRPPRGVEDRAGAREVAADGDPAADLDDRGVAARPGREVAKCASARGEQSDPQLLVGRPARTQDRYPGLRVGVHHPHLVGAPVTDRPERIGVTPQELGTHRVDGLAVASGGPRGTRPGSHRGGAAPSHQPPHRRLHRLWTTSARYELVPHAAMKGARWREGGAAYDPWNAPWRSPVREGEHPYPARRLRRECAPETLPENVLRALKFHGGSGNCPADRGAIFSQIGDGGTGVHTLRAGSARRIPRAQPGRRSSPPGPLRRPRGWRRRCPPAHWIQYSGPTHAASMEALPRWPEKSARTGARPHNGSTAQLRVSDPHFSTDHNPAIRNYAP